MNKLHHLRQLALRVFCDFNDWCLSFSQALKLTRPHEHWNANVSVALHFGLYWRNRCEHPTRSTQKRKKIEESTIESTFVRIYELVDGSRWVHKTLQKKEKIVGFHFQSGNDREMTYCPLNKTHPPRLSGSDFIDVKSSDDARKLRLQPC